MCTRAKACERRGLLLYVGLGGPMLAACAGKMSRRVSQAVRQAGGTLGLLLHT